VRGPPDYISLLGLCSKLEAQNQTLESENRRLKDNSVSNNNNNLSTSVLDTTADAANAEIIELYKQRLEAAEDEILQLRIDEQDTRAMKEKLEWVESDRARLKAELISQQENANSGTFMRDRIKELEDQLTNLKAEMRSDRERHREEMTIKEDAMIKNLKRVSELEKDHASTTPHAVQDIQSLRVLLHNREQQIASLEQQLMSSRQQQQGMTVTQVVPGLGMGGGGCSKPPNLSRRPQWEPL